jgi:hypothetical protein
MGGFHVHDSYSRKLHEIPITFPYAKENAELCLAVVTEIDAVLEAMSPELMAAIEASGNHFRFNRALHRDAHLDYLVRVLGEMG